MEEGKTAASADIPDVRGVCVAFILSALNPGGLELMTLQALRVVQAAGGRALLVSSGGTWVDAVEAAGARHILLPLKRSNPWRWWRAVRALRRLIVTENIDLVQGCAPSVNAGVAWAAGKTARPWLAVVHSDLNRFYELEPGHPLRNTWRRWDRRLQFWALRRADRIVAVSDFVAKMLARMPDLRLSERLVTVTNGIDLSRFDPQAVSPERRQRQAEAWGLDARDDPPDDPDPDPDAEPPLIVVPARVVALKGHELLLEALAGLVDLDWRCVLIGRASTPARDRLLEQIAAWGLQERVSYAGHCADMPAALQLSRIVVCPSIRPETFGLVITEGQAMGRIVVASAHGGALEQVADGVSGFLCAPGDPLALTKALRRALALPRQERQEMGAAARRSAARFDMHHMARKMLTLYQEILKT